MAFSVTISITASVQVNKAGDHAFNPYLSYVCVKYIKDYIFICITAVFFCIYSAVLPVITRFKAVELQNSLIASINIAQKAVSQQLWSQINKCWQDGVQITVFTYMLDPQKPEKTRKILVNNCSNLMH